QVGAPVGAVLPAGGVVPLQHHLRRRVGRVEEDVGVEVIRGADRQPVGGAEEVVLVDAGGEGGLRGQRGGEGGGVGGDPGPGVAAGGRRDGASRQGIVDPHRVRVRGREGPRDRRRHRVAGGVLHARDGRGICGVDGQGGRRRDRDREGGGVVG